MGGLKSEMNNLGNYYGEESQSQASMKPKASGAGAARNEKLVEKRKKVAEKRKKDNSRRALAENYMQRSQGMKKD